MFEYFSKKTLKKYKTTNFLLTGTLKIGTAIKKISMPFKVIEAYNTYKDQIQLMYDGDDVLFTGYLIEFNGLPFQKVKRFVYDKGSGFLKKKNEGNCLIPAKRIVFQMFWCFNRKAFKYVFFEIINGVIRRRTATTETRVKPVCRKVGINFG